MEYLILFLIHWAIPILVRYFILPQDKILMMSPLLAMISPYVVIALLVALSSTLMSIIRSLRTCPKIENESRSYGITSGLKLGLSSSIVGSLMYVVVALLPILMSPFIAFSILPYSTQIGEGFYVAIGGAVGYWLGRLFVDICNKPSKN